MTSRVPTEVDIALGRALDLLPFGVVACDASTRLQFANWTVRAMLGDVHRGTPAERWPTIYELGDAHGQSYAGTLEIPLVKTLHSGVDLNLEMTQRSSTSNALLAAHARRVDDPAGRARGAVIVLVPLGPTRTPAAPRLDSMAIDSALSVAAIGLAGAVAETSCDAGALVVRLRAYIADHLADELTLDTLAVEFGYSPTYLTTLVRRDAGVPAMGLVRQMRLEEGRRLLEQTSLTVAAVSREVSPWDAGYFSRNFRRWMGLSPSEWREESRAPRTAVAWGATS